MKMNHHAILFEGDWESTLPLVVAHIERELQMKPEANPDYSEQVFEQLTIEDARALQERASQAPLGAQQVFVLMFERATQQAQNALLKLLEEPAQNTYFFLLVPTKELLIPTILSRLEYRGGAKTAPAELAFAKKYLHATREQRIKLTEKIVKDKDRAQAKKVLDAIEYQLHAEGVRAHTEGLAEIAFVRQYLSDTSSSLKMLLEHVAVTLP